MDTLNFISHSQNKLLIFSYIELWKLDEQHRFGVNQRIKLASKGNNPNLILTTATPIPRSLALTYYGDIKSLEIKEKPQNRKEIITQVMHQNKKTYTLKVLNSLVDIFTFKQWLTKYEDNQKVIHH